MGKIFNNPFPENDPYAWILALSVILFFALLALYFSFKNEHFDSKLDLTDYFFTARGTQPLWKITWSLYSSCLGAWVLYLPPSAIVDFGIVGVITYAISSGFPIVLLALNGNLLREKFKGIGSFTDYIYFRYGLIPKIVVSLIMIFNMAAALTSEYTMITKFFVEVLQLPGIAFVIIIGLVTMIYTAFGGLVVSILTDQIQGIFCIILIIVFVIFTCINIDFSSIESYPGTIEDEQFGSIFYLPLSMFSATIFSEAIWQRVWASTNSKTLIKASLISSILVALVILLSGFGGILAYCINPEDKDVDKRRETLLFKLMFTRNKVVSYIIGVVISFLAITMNISAVDSLQNGFISTLYSFLLKDQPLLLSRLTVLVINIPAMAIGLYQFDLFAIFCISNLLTSAFVFPVLIGLFDSSNHHVSGLGSMVSGFGALLSLVLYGLFSYTTNLGDEILFTDRFYHVIPFGIALGGSIMFLVLWILIEKLYLKQNSNQLRAYGFKTCHDYISSRSYNEKIHMDEKDPI